MTHSRNTRLLFAVLLVGLGGAFTAQAGGSSEGSAGESEAISYHAQNVDKFIGQTPMITAELAAIAFAQGQSDGPLARRLPTPSADTQGEAQATHYYVQHGSEFAAHSPTITLAQAGAALTEGQL